MRYGSVPTEMNNVRMSCGLFFFWVEQVNFCVSSLYWYNQLCNVVPIT